MSGQHFEIENRNTFVELRDLRSTNGTYIIRVDRNTGKDIPIKLKKDTVLNARIDHRDRVQAGSTYFDVEFRQVEPPQFAEPSEHCRPSRPMVDNSSPVADSSVLGSNVGSGGSSSGWPRPSSPLKEGSQRDPYDAQPLGPSLPYSLPKDPAGPDPERLFDDYRNRPNEKQDSPIDDSADASAIRKLVQPTPGNHAVNDSSRRSDGSRVSPFADSISLSAIGSGGSNQTGTNSSLVDMSSSGSASASGILSPGSVGNANAASAFPSATAQYEFLSKRFEISGADGLIASIETLSQVWSIQTVIHLEKIRVAQPRRISGRSLWRYHNAPVGFGPVAVAWSDVRDDLQAYVDRLCRADAIIAFFGKNLESIGSHLEQLPATAVDGFSEPEGFLNCFWPSSLSVMLDARGRNVCGKLFGDAISGLLMPSPLDSNLILAAGDALFTQSATEIGFGSRVRLLSF